MFDSIKKISKGTAVYSIGQVAPKLVGLILLPFLTNTKYLSPADYGKLSMLEASTALLIALFGFGFNYALERWYFDKAYIDKRKSVIFTLLVATIFLTVVFWGFLSVFSEQLSMFLIERADWTKMLNLMFLCAALESIMLLPTTLLRLEEKPVLFVSSNIFRFIIYLVLTLIFLVVFRKGLEGIYSARAISLVFILLILGIYLFRNISFHFEWKALREMFIYRLPLVLSTISYIVFNITDRFSLRVLSESSFTDVGVYSLGYSMVNSVKVVVLASIWLSLRPMIYKMMDDPQNKRFYSKIMKYMAFCLVFILLAITVFGQEVILVLARNKIYHAAFYIIPILSVALIFDTLKEISQVIGLSIVKRTGIIAITMIIATIINICINIILIPKLNIYGAALSAVISQLFFFVVIYIFSQKFYHVPYELKRILIMTAVFIVLGGLAILTSGLWIVVRIPVKLLIICSFPFLLYIFKFFERVEITRIKDILRKLRNPVELIRIISQE
ncbi:MAG: oligosaccharide flippase family protein [Bacteroidales bacterium]|nr:oligosaccharide flippase family protein [Bacteroidales bacterium]